MENKTSTQKQIDELKRDIEGNCAGLIAIIIIFVIVLGYGSYRSDNLQSQLSHKADRICHNETYEVEVNHTCEFYYEDIRCMEWMPKKTNTYVWGCQDISEHPEDYDKYLKRSYLLNKYCECIKYDNNIKVDWKKTAEECDKPMYITKTKEVCDIK